MSAQLLEVGDKLIESSYGSIQSILIISRVTKTQAFAEKANLTGEKYEIKFKRDDYHSQIGLKGLGSPYYRYGDKDSVESAYNEIKLRNLISEVSRLNFANLNISQLEEIIKIVKGG